MSMWIGKQIEVPFINPAVKTIGMIVHLDCKPQDLALPENGYKAQELVRVGCKYLVDEGFLPENLDGWMTHIGGIAHGKSTA